MGVKCLVCKSFRLFNWSMTEIYIDIFEIILLNFDSCLLNLQNTCKLSRKTSCLPPATCCFFFIVLWLTFKIRCMNLWAAFTSHKWSLAKVIMVQVSSASKSLCYQTRDEIRVIRLKNKTLLRVVINRKATESGKEMDKSEGLEELWCEISDLMSFTPL